jgi:hypothetical protein
MPAPFDVLAARDNFCGTMRTVLLKLARSWRGGVGMVNMLKQ